MYPKVATLLFRICFPRYFFTEFTYILIIFKGYYDAGNTYFTGPFWEANSQSNATVLMQLKGKMFTYLHFKYM